MEDGKKVHGILKGSIEEHIKHFPWLTRNMVSHYIITYMDDNIISMVVVTGTDNQTSVSGLPDASPVAMIWQLGISQRSPSRLAPPQRRNQNQSQHQKEVEDQQ
jgi:hypothetical protein